MPRIFFCLIIGVLILAVLPLGVLANNYYPRVCQFYLDLGQKALKANHPEEALDYFRHAELVCSDQETPLSYINLIKRRLEGAVQVFPPPLEKKKLPPKKGAVVRTEKIKTQALPKIKKIEMPSIESPLPPAKEKKSFLGKTIVTGKKPELLKGPNVVYLNEDLKTSQPSTLLRIELNKSLILEGSHIERFLVITPGFISVEPIDRNRINVHADKRGSTFLHVWDDQGRWTFNVEVIFPIQTTETKVLEKQSEEYAKPFRLSYSSDWNSFYLGQDLHHLERKSLNFLQWTGITGETPYGDFDSAAIFNKFGEDNVLTGYSVGLTKGQIGDFKDFTIRGFDTSKSFSPLSLPGRYFRGFLFESLAFHDNIEYTILQGKDRATFGFLSPGVFERRNSFIEGAKVTLFPKDENHYSLNYAHGFGSGREPFLNDTVYSFEFQRRIKKALLLGEVAHDERNFGRTLATKFGEGKYNLGINFRDIDKDFTTVSNLPPNRGEIGGNIIFNGEVGKSFLNSNLDIFRDRFLPNPENPDALNFDFDTSLDTPLTKSSNLRNSLYFLDTPGELSPRQNLRANSTYTKRFPMFDHRDLTTFVGATYQQSRFKLSPASEYDRYSLSTGFTLPLIKNLSYFANYEYSWVDEKLSGARETPNVFNTGVNYSKQITDSWTGDLGFTYRNEENTQGTNSFLAGEDSITGNMTATYRPSPDFEFFIDGRMRNVWREGPGTTAFNEVDVRCGVRSAWDLPFSWNPTGTIQGVVYKDLNGNQTQDKNEAGIPHVRVMVGKKEVVTNEKGQYKASVKAKKVEVAVEVESIPSGFVFSTSSIKEVQIIPHKVQRIDFGLTTQSGIYGVVFYDANQDGIPDTGDLFISRAKIILDGKETTLSDFEGTYFFKGISPGKHTITIDVNSLPLEYLPLVKLKNEIEVAEGTTYVFHIPLAQKAKDQ